MYAIRSYYATSAVVHDIYTRMLKRDLSPRQVLGISRATVLALGLGAMLIALTETRVIFWFVLFAWSGLGASFGPLILFTLYSRRVTREGAIAGMLTGFTRITSYNVCYTKLLRVSREVWF